MRRYIKLGSMAFLILAIGYLLGSGSIGNLLRFGEETTRAMAEQAEADRIRAEADRETSEALRAISDPMAMVPEDQRPQNDEGAE